MNRCFTHSPIIITALILSISRALGGNAQLAYSDSDEQIANFSHQNETEVLESTHLLTIKSHENKDSDQESGWSEWSEWSTCSRSCEGGISVSLRKCNHKKGCDGSDERHKICNMQPCPNDIDFRAVQCSNYNDRPYRGRLYKWLPYVDPLDPCALTCKSKAFNFVAKLSARVEDGTRCRVGSLDMCVGGKCLSVGCDLQLGSDNKVDVCGICGGDGSSCTRPTYIWTETTYSACSVSCGRGYQMSHPICIDKEAKEQVDEILCDPSLRPHPTIIQCNTHQCPPFWIIESWNGCSRQCGGGKQFRDVYCVQDIVNGTRLKVSDNECPKHKPMTEKSCNSQECPQWFEGPWSECSATCDTGYQTRAVVCRDVRGFYSNECNNETKPYERQNCSTGVHCFQDSNENSQEDSPSAAPLHLPWIHKLKNPSISTEPNFIVSEWSTCSVSCGKGIKKRTVDCKIFLEFSRTVARLPDTQCPGVKPKEIDVCLTKDCDLIGDEENDDEDRDEDEDNSDNDIINSGVEKPMNKMIPLSKIGIEAKYFWKSSGFSECTASCLGGIQESIILCVRDTDHSEVNPFLCDINKKPDSFTRTCNDHPCPPRWNVTEYDDCSKPCGGGVQTREVQCVHEVTRGLANTIAVANHRCAEPMPRTKQFCNVFDCPPEWKTEQWSQCSRSCGGGVKTRKLKCVKELAFGQVVDQSISKCPKKRPKAMKTCNSKQCRNPLLELRKVIHNSKHNIDSNKIEENLFIQKESKKRLSLKVNGEAVVIEGTLLRLRCPRRKADKDSNHTIWLKNNSKITFNTRIKTTTKNILRIKSVEPLDSGVYSCSWNNRSFHGIDLKIRRFLNSDDDKTVERPNFGSNIGTNNYDFGKVVTNSEERSDRSHDISKNNDFVNRKQILMKTKHKRTHSRPKNIRRPQRISSLVEETVSLNNNKIQFKDSVVNEDSFSAESPVNENKERLDTFEVNYGNDNKELSDQNIPNNKENDENSEEKFRGEANKDQSVSQIQQLLTDLRKSSKTESNYLNDNQNNSKISTEHKIDDNFITNAFVLGNGNREHLKFDWMTTDWSTCTLPCGGTGYQVRGIQCYVIYENISKTIDNSFCIDAELKAPETIRNCGEPDCPFWQTGQWSECDQCIDLRTGMQDREVRCALNNGSVLDYNKCQSQPKPIARKQCINDLCEGTWITGEWSQCNANCGEGFQSRVIQCVWFNSAQPAGNACKDKPRPEVLQSCTNDTCSQTECIDDSKHCVLAKTLNMCRIDHYKHLCCQSCKTQT